MQKPKTALITGAASGIGAATAERFLEAGYRVALFDLNGEAARATAARLAAGSKRIVLEGDVSDEGHVKEAVAQTISELGSLDVLVNNAGIEINGTVLELSTEDWDRQMAVNLKSIYLFSRYSLPFLRKGSSIVNIASVHSFLSWPRCPAYDATKAGVVGITRALAVDHGRDGVRVNAVCPGYIETPLLERWFAGDASRRAEALQSHPLGRLGTPRDVAEAALFLASDASSFISGACLTVDGGLTALGH